MTTGLPVDYLMVGALVFAGSVVPVVPTGAVVTAAAALAMGGRMPSLVGVVLLGAAGAFAGDILTFALCRLGGPRARQWVVRGRAQALDGRVRRLQQRGGPLIVASRLIPAGRIPTLAAAGTLGYPWVRFLLADGAGVILWVIVYSGLGVAGGNAFARPWVGALAALAAVLVVEVVLHVGRRLRAARRVGPKSGSPAEAAQAAS